MQGRAWGRLDVARNKGFARAMIKAGSVAWGLH